MFWMSLNVFGSLRSLLGEKDWPAEIKKHPTKNKYLYIWKKISYAQETWPYVTQNIAIPNKECNIEVVFVYLRHMEILIFNCPVVVTSSLEGCSGEVVGQLRLIVWTLEIVAMVGTRSSCMPLFYVHCIRHSLLCVQYRQALYNLEKVMKHIVFWRYIFWKIGIRWCFVRICTYYAGFVFINYEQIQFLRITNNQLVHPHDPEWNI